jgi:hypothetical protein
MDEPSELGDDPILSRVDKRKRRQREEPDDHEPRRGVLQSDVTPIFYRVAAVVCLLVGCLLAFDAFLVTFGVERGEEGLVILTRSIRGGAVAALACFAVLVARLFQAGAHARRRR